MYVYVLQTGIVYEGSTIEGIYTEEAGEKAFSELFEKMKLEYINRMNHFKKEYSIPEMEYSFCDKSATFGCEYLTLKQMEVKN